MVLLLTITNLMVVKIFRETSKKLVVEYIELDAILEFKLSLNQLQQPVSRYAVYGEKNIKELFKAFILQSHEKLEDCQKMVTDVHNHDLLDNYFFELEAIDSLASAMFEMGHQEQHQQILNLMEEIIHRINDGVGKIDILLLETKLEIDEYSELNHTMMKHSTLTIFGLGLFVLLIIIVGGLIFIRSMTKPIQKLVSATEVISKGGRLSKVSLESGDELGLLAKSFNSMVESLQNTTVSRNYLNLILESMHDPLVVTDIHGNISLFNPATTDMFGYSSEELSNQNVDLLFHTNSSAHDEPQSRLSNILSERKTINTEINLYPKTGKPIPVLVSAAILKSENDSREQMIMVVHDLSVQRSIAAKLETERKKRLIAINEAQEEERFRVAIDLHDGLGQVLTAISYKLQEEIMALDPNEEGAQSVLAASVQEQLDAAIRETKSLAHNLIPIVLKDFGLITAISKLIDLANNMHETHFTFNAYDFKERVDPKIEKALYRICQEAVNNIVKHAQATAANFQLFRHESSLVLVIDDDGLGFDTNTYESTDNKSGIGLVSMRERVLSFDGEISVDSTLNEGTEIIIEIPLN